MRTKRIRSVLLAAVMACGLLCTPAFASYGDNSAEVIEKRLETTNACWHNIWIGSMAERGVDVKLRGLDWSEGSVAVRRTDSDNFRIPNLYRYPKGVTLTAGPNFRYGSEVQAYSDPDGDGVYELRLQRRVRRGSGDGSYWETEVVPVSQPGPFVSSDTVEYADYFEWDAGWDCLEWPEGQGGGYRTISTDVLTEMFGPDTIVMFCSEDYLGPCVYLTGEERAPRTGGAEDKTADANWQLESFGLTVTETGYLCSTWAKDAVDGAMLNDVFPWSVSYNLRRDITRGEFAALAVGLYRAMAGGREMEYLAESPFTDVEQDNDNYFEILWAQKLGIVRGTSTAAKTFEPDAKVSRQDAALMLARVYTVLGGSIPSGASAGFADGAEITPYARNAVAFMSGRGIVSGMGGNRFNPKGNASVEQALKIALEMLDRLKV